ncbi:MAG: glycogen phosphorylase, partial [Cyanobacteriota bacterium]
MDAHVFGPPPRGAGIGEERYGQSVTHRSQRQKTADMTIQQPRNLRLPTPGCYADPDRSGLLAEDVFDGMTEHLFYTLGKLAPTASRHDLYMALS